ncbi:MAG: redox-regulated ATPase YchF [Endomicrobiales bacterium]
MEIGIIGLPNVGKSTLFNLLTRLSVPAENFPFTTIEPNVGVVPVPDARLAALGRLFKPKKLTPAVIKFVDIAGLVKGASRGEGLGNKFLSHIREMDALVQVIRAFEKADVVNVSGRIDPEEEKGIVETELVLADLEQANRLKEKCAGAAKSGEKTAREKFALLDAVARELDRGVPVRRQNVPAEEVREYQFLTAKPLLYVLNADENCGKDTGREDTIALCVKLEEEILELPEEEQEKFRREMGLESSGLERLIRAGQNLLGLITFYTVVGTEVRAWNIRKGSTVLAGAGMIHTDMEKGFIRAEVYNFSELEAHGTEKALQEKGLVRSEGKDYPLKNGDIVKVHFRAP